MHLFARAARSKDHRLHDLTEISPLIDTERVTRQTYTETDLQKQDDTEMKRHRERQKDTQIP